MHAFAHTYLAISNKSNIFTYLLVRPPVHCTARPGPYVLKLFTSVIYEFS